MVARPEPYRPRVTGLALAPWGRPQVAGCIIGPEPSAPLWIMKYLYQVRGWMSTTNKKQDTTNQDAEVSQRFSPAPDSSALTRVLGRGPTREEFVSLAIQPHPHATPSEPPIAMTGPTAENCPNLDQVLSPGLLDAGSTWSGLSAVGGSISLNLGRCRILLPICQPGATTTARA